MSGAGIASPLRRNSSSLALPGSCYLRLPESLALHLRQIQTCQFCPSAASFWADQVSLARIGASKHFDVSADERLQQGSRVMKRSEWLFWWEDQGITPTYALDDDNYVSTVGG